MPLFARQPYKTPYCNRHCQPLLKCPPGSHISSTRKSCVWNGKPENSASSSPGLLASILNSASEPSSSYSRPTPSQLMLGGPSSSADDNNNDYDDYMRERGSDTFGGRRKKRSHSRRKSHSK